MSTNPNNLIPMRDKKLYNMPLPPRREYLWLKEGKKCHWCGSPTRLVADLVWDQATIEHIIPRGRGGTSEEENLTSSCFRCNQRRNYEDLMGFPDGSLLGKYPVNKNKKTVIHNTVHGVKKSAHQNTNSHVSLTGDEKKAIINGGKKSADQNHIEQRDQALLEIASLKRDLRISEGKERSIMGELTLFQKIVEDQNEELKILKSITVWKLIRKRLSDWLAP